MHLDDEILTKIKRNYAHIWTHIIGEDPPEIFKTDDEEDE